MTPHTHDYEFGPLPLGTIALGVPDVAEAKATLEAAGVEVDEIWDSGVCHGAGFRDPAGNSILLHHRYAPYGPRASDGSMPNRVAHHSDSEPSPPWRGRRRSEGIQGYLPEPGGGG